MWFGSTKKNNTQRVYLDYAAATPVRQEVADAMEPYMRQHFGNPSAIHQEGVYAREAVESSREAVARLLGVRTESVVFTGSGTEANNLALFGVVEKLRADGRGYEDMEIISSPLEHPSIIKSLERLSAWGVIVTYAPVTQDGRIDTKALSEMLSGKTILVTCAYVNSEIGVIEDARKIARVVDAYRRAHGAEILVHTDASQAPLWLSCQLERLGVDLMTLDAGKCYGPKGIGVLALRHGVHASAHVIGGGQEQGLRGGTENVPNIVGCAASLTIAQHGYEARSAQVALVRDHMIERLTHEIDGVVLNGSTEHRIANNVNISLPGIDTEYAVIWLDAQGIAASTKSACSGKSSAGSAVVRAISQDEKRASSTIRFTLGEDTTIEEVERAVSLLKEHVLLMRNK